MTTKRTHRLPILLSILGEEHEIEVDVTYTITRGRAATPPSYASGGDPPEDAEIKVTEIYVVSKGFWLFDIIANSDAAYQALGDAADWGETMRDPDYAREDAQP